VAVHLKAIDRILLSRADTLGLISFHGDSADEIDIYMDALYRLEAHGLLVRDQGNAPLRPFVLTYSGRGMRALVGAHAQG